MINLLARIIYKLSVRGERIALLHRIRSLNKQGHSFSMDATYDRRLEIHVEETSTITTSDGVQILNDTWLITHAHKHLSIGKNTFVSQHCTISGNVTIGEDTLIASFVNIIDANHNFEDAKEPIREQGGRHAPIRIGNDVWIGTHCVVLQGVTIGDHCVIGANSTVTEDLPPWSVCAGNPARVIGRREH